MPTTIQTIARLFSDRFTAKTRDNGEVFVCLLDGSPEWMAEAIHAAHGDRFPEDGIYRLCKDAAEFIADNEAADDEAAEFADGAVSVYHADRYRWLAAHLDNANYVDQARDEGLVADDASISDRIAAGMLEQAREVYSAIYEAIEEKAEEYENEPRFVAGWNMPGYMPESEPAEFAAFDDAMEYIFDELVRFEDEAAETDSIHAINEADAAQAVVRAWEESSIEHNITVGQYVYWIRPIE